jgi:hypothetical protein
MCANSLGLDETPHQHLCHATHEQDRSTCVQRQTKERQRGNVRGLCFGIARGALEEARQGLRLCGAAAHISATGRVACAPRPPDATWPRLPSRQATTAPQEQGRRQRAEPWPGLGVRAKQTSPSLLPRRSLTPLEAAHTRPEPTQFSQLPEASDRRHAAARRMTGRRPWPARSVFRFVPHVERIILSTRGDGDWTPGYRRTLRCAVAGFRRPDKG